MKNVCSLMMIMRTTAPKYQHIAALPAALLRDPAEIQRR